MCLPFMLIALSQCFYFSGIFLSKFKFLSIAKTFGPNFVKLEANIVRTLIILFFVTYTYVVVQLGKPFACRKEYDGKYTMVSSPSLNCYDDEWKRNLPQVIFFAIIYVVILPGILLYNFLNSNRKKLISSAWFVDRFGVISMYFKPRYFYWELVVTIKKIMFSLISNVFGNSVGSSTKQFLVVCLLFGFLLLDVLFFPYGTVLTNQCNML